MSNESPFAPSARVLRAILDAATRANLYPAGSRDLCERLAARDGFTASSVMLGAGSAELIDVVIRTFVGPGEEVLLSVPTFSMYEARTRVVGGIPVLVPVTDDHDVDVGALIRAVTERTKVLFLCSPNNPTGNRIAEADLRRIARLGLPTVVDEAYLELGDSPSYAYLMREYPNVIVLRTFSKAFGLAGMRLGYALAHESVIQLLARVKVPWNVPGVTLAAAIAVLDEAAEFESRISELKAARTALSEGLGRLPGLSVLESEGNFVLVDISRTGYTADQLVRAVLDEGVLIRSLSVHHAERRFVRVTVGTREQNARCVAAMESALRGLRRPAVVVPLFAVAPGDAE
jgi:histidinol-phosphate aminotransferase